MNLRDNNFNLLKMLGGFIVLFLHSYPLTGSTLSASVMAPFINPNLGNWAVNLFFAISGLLVASSFLKNPNLMNFFRLRTFRLIPAIAVNCFLCAFIMGPLVTTLPLSEYFSTRATYDFFINNTLLTHTEYHLPGVFLNLPYPDAVNGSLWTLRYEVKMYLLLAVLGVLGAFRNRAFLYSMIALYGALWFVHTFYPQWISEADSYTTTKRISLYFILGACMQVFAQQIRYSWAIAAGLCIGAILLKDSSINQLTTAIASVYSIFCFATLVKGPIRNFNKLDDISYGFYIYAFPVQQCLALFFPGITFWPMFVAATVLAWICGWLSWRLVEKPALDYCARLNKQKQDQLNKAG